MRLALGETVVRDEIPHRDRLAYLFYVQAPEELRTITVVEGLSELRAVAGVDEIVLNRGPGRYAHWREGNHGYMFSVTGTVADHDELRHVDGLVWSLVRISGEQRSRWQSWRLRRDVLALYGHDRVGREPDRAARVRRNWLSFARANLNLTAQ